MGHRLESRLVRSDAAKGLNTRPRVLFTDRMFPHYRQHLIEFLASSDEHCFYFGADWEQTTRASKRSGIASLEHQPASIKQLSMMRLWKIEWQRGVLKSVWCGEYDAFILLGDWKIASTWVACLVGRIRSVPVLLWTHGWLNCDGPVKYLVRYVLYRLAAGLLLYGEFATKVASMRNFDQNRVHTMYNSIDSAEILRQRLALTERAHPGQASRPAHIVMVSRLTAERRVHTLLYASQILARRGTPVQVTVVGDGPELERLKALAQTLKLPLDVIFKGAVYDTVQLARIYEQADICVLPGQAGLAVLKALGHGVPVLVMAGDLCQMPEAEAVKHGSNGWIARGSSPVVLATEIQKMLESGLTRATTYRTCIQSLLTNYCTERQAEKISIAVTKSLC